MPLKITFIARYVSQQPFDVKNPERILELHYGYDNLFSSKSLMEAYQGLHLPKRFASSQLVSSRFDQKHMKET